MNSPLRSSSMLLLCCMALFVDAAHGQTLSIVRKAGSECWIKATAPPGTRYVLQESANLHLWVDINDAVSGQSSNRFDGAGITTRYFRLAPYTPPAPLITIVLLGDSTVADGSGWGWGIYGYFKSNLRVVNLAHPWHSTKWFLTSDEKATMLQIKPNVVFIQFGLTDEESLLDAYRTTLTEYRDNLKTIVQMVRGFNGTPILITPTANRLWDDKGKVRPWLVNRSLVMKDLAAELKVYIIDLNQMTTDLYNELGESGCDFMLWVRPDDGIHFSVAGAQVIAGLVVNAFPDNLGTYLTGIFNPPPKP